MNFLVFSLGMVSLLLLFFFFLTFLLFCIFRSKVTYHGLGGLSYVRASNYSLCRFNIFGVGAVSNMDACLLFPQYVPAIIPVIGAVQMQWPMPTLWQAQPPSTYAFSGTSTTLQPLQAVSVQLPQSFTWA